MRNFIIAIIIIALSCLLLCPIIKCNKQTTEASTERKSFCVDTLRARRAMEQAAVLGPIMQQLADSIAHLHGGCTCTTDYKSLSSTLRKCWTDSVQADQLKDLVRTTIACPFDSLKPLITDLVNTAKAKHLFMRYKHQEIPERAYWGDIVNLQQDGMYCEIMIRSYYMAFASHNRGLKELVGDSLIARIKEETQQEPSRGHYFYEVVRDISGKYSEEDKKQAMLDSYDYYRHFWEGYQLGMEFYSESSF